MRRIKLLSSLLLIYVALLPTREGLSQGSSDAVVVRFEAYEGPATILVQTIEKHKIKITVDPKSETNGLLIRVELPKTGRDTWPAADVEVRDERGEAIVVRRSGIEWNNLLIPVPSVRNSYIVQAVYPPQGRLQFISELERQLIDSETGFRVAVSKWYDARQAALSIRFDDSHPTHLTKAIPILREYGFRCTFMINPGPYEPGSRQHSAFQMHRSEWEAVAKSGGHEFANHSAHHRGATDDEDMDAEIGEAARTIWKMTPGQSRLTALNLGGGTQWATTHTLRYYLDKYHHFDASGGSLGMDDTYGNRVNAFREHLERHIKSHGWCRIHFHYIGEGLSSSEANFRAALDIVKEHETSLWIAGMADIYKYQFERNRSSLRLVETRKRRLTFKLSCQTDTEFYDQPLTIEITPPPDWPAERIRVSDSQGEAVTLKRTSSQTILQCDLVPRSAAYTIELIN